MVGLRSRAGLAQTTVVTHLELRRRHVATGLAQALLVPPTDQAAVGSSTCSNLFQGSWR